MLTLQGAHPTPEKGAELRILPWLKSASEPPNFDFTKLRQNLIDMSDDKDRIRILRGLHEKLYRESYPSMERFLQRLGVPDRCYDLLKVAIESCSSCAAFAPPPRRPKFGAELAGHFGDILVVDLFYL